MVWGAVLVEKHERRKTRLSARQDGRRRGSGSCKEGKRPGGETTEVSVTDVRSYEGRTVNAWASNADEGRGTLRKASGSCVRTLYPRISEWGNPAGRTPVTGG